MSEININDLPHEMIMKVFGFLDVVNMNNAILTCKLWNNLLESTCRWSLKLEYDYDGKLKLKTRNSEQKMTFILTTNRKFGTIEIRGGRLSDDHQILEIFQRHGFNVVKLILSRCRINNLSEFAELLNITPNLKHAVIKSFSLQGGGAVLLDPILPDLKRFKTLEIVGSDQRIVHCFRKSKLTTIRIWDNERFEHCKSLADFVSTQETLTSLTANARSIVAEIGKLNVPIPFRLSQLEIFSYGQKSSRDNDNLLRFVKTQTGSLTEVEIRNAITSSVYECVFASMTKLNTLSVNVDEIPREDNVYGRLKENRSVRVLSLQDCRLDVSEGIQFLRNFLKKLPNIRNLILPYNLNDKVLPAAAQNLSKLECLFVGSANDERLFDDMKFSNLKMLHIKHLRVKINWSQFTKTHCRLTELVIETMEDESFLTSDDVDQMTTNVDLQNIRLGIRFVAVDRFFEIIRAKCTNLNVLDLHRSCISRGLGHNVKINVLRLCDDIKCSNVF